ncbi:MAG: GNAT family protein [Melioribacteraceae bacterium]|nr:GNAT family protein [Melioribacteraceae bacterium]
MKKIIVKFEPYYTKYDAKLFDNIFTNLPRIETDRLILRKLQYSDQADIYSYAQNPNVAKHVLWEAHKDIFDTIKFLNIILEAYSENRAAPWGIEHKTDRKIIGTVGFVSFESEIKKAEIGYAISENYWNQGIITEAISEVISFGFEKMMLDVILARCKPINIASYKVIEKFNFKYEGIFEKNMYIKSRFEDMKVYTLTAERFRSTNN